MSVGSPLCNAAGKLLCHPASHQILWKINAPTPSNYYPVIVHFAGSAWCGSSTWPGDASWGGGFESDVFAADGVNIKYGLHWSMNFDGSIWIVGMWIHEAHKLIFKSTNQLGPYVFDLTSIGGCDHVVTVTKYRP